VGGGRGRQPRLAQGRRAAASGDQEIHDGHCHAGEEGGRDLSHHQADGEPLEDRVEQDDERANKLNPL